MKKFFFLFSLITLLGCCSSSVANTQPVLIADPRVLSIPICDNQEPLVDLRKEGGIAIGPSPEIPNNTDYTFVRKSVAEKLLQAQKKLPPGLQFQLYEGYRSLALQKKLFDTFFAKIKKEHPSWSYKQQFLETTHLVSPVINLDASHNIPPHSTGAAIDVYLVDTAGKSVPMGIHPKDWMQDLDGSLSLPHSQKISAEARHYRAIMSRALKSVGFVNLDTEYWHWSYGDRYWAFKNLDSKSAETANKSVAPNVIPAEAGIVSSSTSCTLRDGAPSTTCSSSALSTLNAGSKKKKPCAIYGTTSKKSAAANNAKPGKRCDDFKPNKSYHNDSSL
ncbi:MAG: M15 family metallopeptidase [Chthoniobacterales bacterium]